MLPRQARNPIWWCEFESGEIESGCHDASDQRPCAKRSRGLRPPCRHNGLQCIAAQNVAAESCLSYDVVRVSYFQQQWPAGLMDPNFIRINAVPVGARTCWHQKEWRSRLGDRPNLLALATFLDITRLLDAAEAQAFLSVRALQH